MGFLTKPGVTKEGGYELPNVYLSVLFNLRCLIITSVLLLVTACFEGDTRPITPEEVNTLKFRVNVEGVSFDVPVRYHHEEFEALKVWPRPPRAQVEGRKRPKVDVIKITALLPNMDPYTPASSAEFDKPGWGRKVLVYLTKRRVNWSYYFAHFSNRLKKLPESPEVPGMLHFHDPLANNDVYFSHARPHPNLIRIICPIKNKVPSPSCNLQAVYMDKFDLQITFARQYLSQWREIERNTKALLDHFRESAKPAQLN